MEIIGIMIGSLRSLLQSVAQVAQSVEQRTENPRVDGSIPPLGTTNSKASLNLFCERLFYVYSIAKAKSNAVIAL